MDNINYNTLNLVGMELFRKNNQTFMSSSLKGVMGRLFIAANKKYGIKDSEDVSYMKSGSFPNRVFYIYSDELLEKAPDKLLDVVYLNGKPCIWFYSKNLINSIDKDPMVMFKMFKELILAFMPKAPIGSFMYDEHYIVAYVLTIRLAKFIHETYVLDLEKFKEELHKNATAFTKESVELFINDVLDRCEAEEYFINREFLESYMLLEEGAPTYL